MKKLTFVALICLLSACKKEQTSQTLTVSVSNLPNGTTYNINITDKKKGTAVLQVTNGSGPYNQTAGVTSGQQISIDYRFTYVANPVNSGVLNISVPSKVLFQTGQAGNGIVDVTVP